MKKYLIERETPRVGTFERELLPKATAKSNYVCVNSARISSGWSLLSLPDKMFCVYLAENEVTHPPARRSVDFLLRRYGNRQNDGSMTAAHCYTDGLVWA